MQKTVQNKTEETFYYQLSEKIPFVPGQIIALKLYSLDDDHFFPEKIDPEKATNPSIIIPAIVSSVIFSFDLFPVYNVRIIWRTRTLEILGYNEITNIPLWRYAIMPATIDTIPKWFIENIDEVAKNGEKDFFDIPITELCYLDRNESGKLELVYKWRDENFSTVNKEQKSD